MTLVISKMINRLAFLFCSFLMRNHRVEVLRQSALGFHVFFLPSLISVDKLSALIVVIPLYYDICLV